MFYLMSSMLFYRVTSYSSLLKELEASNLKRFYRSTIGKFYVSTIYITASIYHHKVYISSA